VEIGELVGRGRTSDVYAFGAGSVVKVPHADVPRSWPEFEAGVTRAVGAHGVPAPIVRDVVTVEGRSAVVYERIEGPSMWQQMLDEPANAAQLTVMLANIQRSLVSAGTPAGIPDLVDRLTRKINVASALSAAERLEAVDLVQRLPRGAALLHGDLHPGNVLMGANGPVVIDWFDASIGHPVADFVRSSILIQPERSVELRHLPGAHAGLLQTVHDTYLAEFAKELSERPVELSLWQAVVAAGRLAEHAEQDESGLLEIWASR